MSPALPFIEFNFIKVKKISGLNDVNDCVPVDASTTPSIPPLQLPISPLTLRATHQHSQIEKWQQLQACTISIHWIQWFHLIVSLSLVKMALILLQNQFQQTHNYSLLMRSMMNQLIKFRIMSQSILTSTTTRLHHISNINISSVPEKKTNISNHNKVSYDATTLMPNTSLWQVCKYDQGLWKLQWYSKKLNLCPKDPPPFPHPSAIQNFNRLTVDKACTLKVENLKVELKERGLKTGGKNDELIAQLNVGIKSSLPVGNVS